MQVYFYVDRRGKVRVVPSTRYLTQDRNWLKELEGAQPDVDFRCRQRDYDKELLSFLQNDDIPEGLVTANGPGEARPMQLGDALLLSSSIPHGGSPFEFSPDTVVCKLFCLFTSTKVQSNSDLSENPHGVTQITRRELASLRASLSKKADDIQAMKDQYLRDFAATPNDPNLLEDINIQGWSVPLQFPPAVRSS